MAAVCKYASGMELWLRCVNMPAMWSYGCGVLICQRCGVMAAVCKYASGVELWLRCVNMPAVWSYGCGV